MSTLALSQIRWQSVRLGVRTSLLLRSNTNANALRGTRHCRPRPGPDAPDSTMRRHSRNRVKLVRPHTVILLIGAATCPRDARAATLPVSLPSANTYIIDYGGGQWSGTVPTQFGLLSLCTEMNLGSNQITGSLPTQVTCHYPP